MADLLTPSTSARRSGRTAKMSVELPNEEVSDAHTVFKVLANKTEDDADVYLVKWEGKAGAENLTWETKGGVTKYKNGRESLAAYEKRQTRFNRNRALKDRLPASPHTPPSPGDSWDKDNEKGKQAEKGKQEPSAAAAPVEQQQEEEPAVEEIIDWAPILEMSSKELRNYAINKGWPKFEVTYMGRQEVLDLLGYVEQEFMVHKVHDMRADEGNLELLVHWEGFNDEVDFTWENAEDMGEYGNGLSKAAEFTTDSYGMCMAVVSIIYIWMPSDTMLKSLDSRVEKEMGEGAMQSMWQYYSRDECMHLAECNRLCRNLRMTPALLSKLQVASIFRRCSLGGGVVSHGDLFKNINKDDVEEHQLHFPQFLQFLCCAAKLAWTPPFEGEEAAKPAGGLEEQILSSVNMDQLVGVLSELHTSHQATMAEARPVLDDLKKHASLQLEQQEQQQETLQVSTDRSENKIETDLKARLTNPGRRQQLDSRRQEQTKIQNSLTSQMDEQIERLQSNKLIEGISQRRMSSVRKTSSSGGEESAVSRLQRRPVAGVNSNSAR